MDKVRFEKLFDELEQPLLRYAFFLVKEEEFAKDIVQDSFIKLLKQEQQPENAKAWMYTVCRNLIIDNARRAKKIIFHENYAELSPGYEEKDEIMEDENVKEIRRVIDRLPLVEKEVVILKFYEMKSYKEISLLTGKSVTNVGFILHQAIKRLKSLLKKDESLTTGIE
ncbi:MAG: hypothetical protein COA79_25550 [Planctomycetota bacterium]|nr:MAG: hypothetical protein COA79_25550 [Planctomycetota bacterium]